MTKWTAKVLWMLPSFLFALLLMGCVQGSPTPTPEPRATATVAPTSPPPTSTETTTRSAPGTATATPASPTATAWPKPTASLPTRTSERGSLPDLLARITLAPADARLYDLLLDTAVGRLYVTDTSGQLHVLDATTYETVATLPATGDLTLDPEHDRLYASPASGEGDLTVVDAQDLTLIGTVSPGGGVALDSSRGRFYLGNPVYGPSEANAPGVRVYDADTLIKVGEVAQPGLPAYNPLRDELYVAGYTIHVVDPDTLRVTGDLLPEIAEQQPPWCNGCLAATQAHVYPDQNLVMVQVRLLSAGKGPGKIPPPRFFDATTLQEITDLAETPPVEYGCQERPILAAPVDGLVYRGQRYRRYVYYNNLLVYDREGTLVDWRDGLSLGVTNPNTGQMYVPHGDETLVLDLGELAPIGTLPLVCFHTLGTETGGSRLPTQSPRIHALADRDLVVFSEVGGWPEPPITGQPGPLPKDSASTGQVLSIEPSPDYARDQTLFLTMSSGRLYRSTDGGQTWAQLRGGLPEGDYLNLDLAVSPGFSTDQTLFVGGFRGEFWGEGVYRSTDSGDTWQPMWRDLGHLRVYDVVLSPQYPSNGTLLAYSNYQRITPWKSGASVFRSTDRGLHWTEVLTRSQATDLPPPEELLPASRAEPAIRFRGSDDGQGVERTIDGARSWEPLALTGQPNFYVQSIQQSPTFAVDHTLYVLTEYDLFRSTNGGQAWERWRDQRLDGRDYTDKLATAATSPVLPDGGHQLFIGTHAGEFWVLAPEQLTWEAVRIAERWPTVLEGEWVGEIETSPHGDVWLGTWGEGLARYAEGSIQARQTITEGLPTQYVGALAAAPDGVLWAGGDLPPGVASFDGEAWTSRPFPDKDAVGAVHALAIGQDGQVWAGGQAPGLLRWAGQAWEHIYDPEGLTGWRINDIEIDKAGTVWAATAGGLVFYSAEGWSGEGGPEATAVELGPENTAYVLLSDASVWRYAGGQWSKLPSLQEGNILSASTLHADADGAVWVGTHAGAFRYDGRSWRQFTAQDGLPSNDVAAINHDGGGWLWFGTSNGAARVNPKALDLSLTTWPAIPTPTPQATATPAPRGQPTPRTCPIPPADSFAGPYKEPRIASKLECPTAGATSTPAAYQPFEYGLMFWRADERVVYVLQADGSWMRYADTWDSGQSPYDAALTPPADLLQPVRGFGLVWRERLGGPGASIGWALAEEQGYEMLAQPFARGQIFTGPKGEVYILHADSTWEARE